MSAVLTDVALNGRYIEIQTDMEVTVERVDHRGRVRFRYVAIPRSVTVHLDEFRKRFVKRQPGY